MTSTENVPMTPVVEDASVEEVTDSSVEVSSEEKIESEESVSSDINVEELHSMEYVELNNALQTINKNRKDLETSYAMVKQLQAVYTNAGDMREAFENAMLSDPELEKDQPEVEKFLSDPEEFDKEYQENAKRLDDLAAAINAELEERYGSIKKTMKFWDDETITYLKKVRSETEKELSNPNRTSRERQFYRDNLHRIDLELRSMDDRFDMIFWVARSINTASIRRAEKDSRKDFLKNLVDCAKIIHKSNPGLTGENFHYFYSYLVTLVPDTVKVEKTLVAQIFIRMLAKVSTKRETALYSTRFVNMVFSFLGDSYGYPDDDTEKSKASIESKIQKILENIGNSITKNTQDMYSRYTRKLRSGKTTK